MAEVAVPPRRSRITPEREAELYEAVLELLREVGYDALTMDAVAARTRSSKATLYRQWGGKAELVARALKHNKPVSMADIDTGSLRGDFMEMVALQDDCKMKQDQALMRGLFHAIHGNPELRQALRQLLIEPEITGLNELLRRAVARGEIDADNPAFEYVIHMLVGGFVARDLVEERPADQDFLRSYINAVILPALGVSSL
ncbi:TetR/AcrR family transcriptional regulator [Streptomyces flavofungini]|uniref:TetR/AcrR family transcriptional regulator n=1 Tax=Streptomyces flavofungini TaxID=68200 RepID=A0ABS0X0A0_9ACTN|nr:TetR/AcrR family transcriptional regulator [Streptomyces flavofungini]MBJ3806607.1 TetR/AcrR family transcriptional regulator [Streptomyces flavofungini]GHC61772.1 TetR family transcriptional regulator [Streptomyces flavofungini]